MACLGVDAILILVYLCVKISILIERWKVFILLHKKIHVMKKLHIYVTIIFFFFLFEIQSIQAQRNEWVNQVIIVNGGRFESAPPYSDYVTVQKYDPVTHVVTVFDIIYTQSTQDVIIDGHFAYVAAQDSIVKYDIDTYQRVSAIADSGMSKLYKHGNKILVSKAYPIKRFFLEVLDENLSLLARVQGISGECGGITSVGNIVYVAVTGGYSGTEGKLARINASNWTVMGETNFGPDAVGIWNLYSYDYKIYSINRTPSGNPNQGSLTVYDISGDSFLNHVIDVAVGDGAGIKDNLLYLKMNEGLGSFNLDTKQIADTTIIPDPGSADRKYIISAAVDYINSLFYINIGNRSTYGYGMIATLAGDSIGSYTEGINADAIAIDYRTPVGIDPDQTFKDFVSIYPNPVTDILLLNLIGKETIKHIKITDLTGRVIYDNVLNGNEKTLKINCEKFPSGVYLISFMTGNGVKTRKFIKQ